MGAVRVTPTTKPSCNCMDSAGEAPSPSTLNSVTATRADITPPWADGGATGGTGVGGMIGGAVAGVGAAGTGAGWTGVTGAGVAG